MRFDYAKSQATAARLVGRFGADAFLRQKGPPVAGDDPWAPSSSAPLDTPILALLSNYSDSDRQGTLIAQGDRKVLFAALGLAPLGVTPAEGDQIVIGARVFTIQALTTIEPGGVPIFYSAQVRL